MAFADYKSLSITPMVNIQGKTKTDFTQFSSSHIYLYEK